MNRSFLLNRRYEVQLLPLEDMTVHEQLQALRLTTVLVGVHGSGLNNVMFLPAGAALVQLLPFGLGYKSDFQAHAEHCGVAYYEWQAQTHSSPELFVPPEVPSSSGSAAENSNLPQSVVHWDLLPKSEAPVVAAAGGPAGYLARGGTPGAVSDAALFTFWINQDVRVPVDEFLAVLGEAVGGSDLNQELLRVNSISSSE